MTKTISVNDKTWKELATARINLGYRNINEVIESLLEISKKIKEGKKEKCRKSISCIYLVPKPEKECVRELSPGRCLLPI